MFYRSWVPGPPLHHFIDYLWAYGDTPSHPRERIVPTGTVELVINLRADEIRIEDVARPWESHRYSGAFVSGPYESFFVVDARQQASLLGVHFKPGGAVPFLGARADELANRHVDLCGLWGPSARELRERLCEAGTTEARFRLLETALRAHVLRPLEHHPAVPIALQAFQAEARIRLRDLARGMGLSQRRFIQVFTAEVGLTPKLFARVQRFQRVVEVLGRVRRPDWSRLAVACGYYDQSHLIRDFMAFSGFSPTAYLQRPRDLVKDHHVPIGDPGQLHPIPAPIAAAD